MTFDLADWTTQALPFSPNLSQGLAFYSHLIIIQQFPTMHSKYKHGLHGTGFCEVVTQTPTPPQALTPQYLLWTPSIYSTNNSTKLFLFQHLIQTTPPHSYLCPLKIKTEPWAPGKNKAPSFILVAYVTQPIQLTVHVKYSIENQIFECIFFE